MAFSLGSSSNDSDDLVAEINVTPLVDVILVLLIIFMITAPIIYQSAIKVQLPKAQTGEAIENTVLRFTIQKDGTLLLDDRAVNLNDVAQKIKSLGDRINEQQASVSADRDTPHGKVIELMDVLRQNGMTRFSLTVEGTPK